MINSPTEKGMKASCLRSFPSLPIHLSGLKRSGSFQYIGSMCRRVMLGMRRVSVGMVYPDSSTVSSTRCRTPYGAVCVVINIRKTI